MDFSPLLQPLSGLGPWGVVVGGVLVILLQRMNLKLPSLPNPLAPKTPEPTPTPAPVTPTDPLESRPWLKLLLSLIALKSAGELAPEDKVVVGLLEKEIGELKAK